MGQTTEFQYPWPELSEVADGPDGYQDLAARAEAAYPLPRLYTHISGDYNGAAVMPNTTRVIVSDTRASVAVGWIEVDFGILIRSPSPGNDVAAGGSVFIKVNGVLVGQAGWHTYAQTQQVDPRTTGKMIIPRSMSSFTVECSINVENGSYGNGMLAGRYNIDIWQHGAPR